MDVCEKAACEYDCGPDCEKVNFEWVNCHCQCYKDSSLVYRYLTGNAGIGKMPSGSNGETPSDAFPKYFVSYSPCKTEDGRLAIGEDHDDVDNITDCALRCDL